MTITAEAFEDGHLYTMGAVNAYCPKCSEIASGEAGRSITVLACEYDTEDDDA